MAPPGYVSCQPLNTTTAEPTDLGKDDLNALLYIVVTLLFYSMGIIIGIITYLKREQAEMEEDKMFDLYLSLKREPFNLYKQERVQQMADYLKQVEEARIAREKIELWNADQQLHNSKSYCADMSQREPGECSTTALGKDGLPLPKSDSDFQDNGGASALLCSLTLGVCEPLLTPEGAQSRFPYPGRPVMVKSNDPQTSPRLISQRHSAPSLNSVRISKSTDSDDINESSDDVFSTKINADDFQDSKNELQELRLLNFRMAKAAFQKLESKSSDQSSISCGNPVVPVTSSTNPGTNAAHITAFRRSSMLKRQLSLDSEGKMSSPDSSLAEITPTIASRNPTIEEELSNLEQNDPVSPEESCSQKLSASNPATFMREPTSSKERMPAEQEPNLPLVSVPETLSQQNQRSDRKTPHFTADVRPKVYDNFLSSTSTISSDTKDTIPAAKKRLYSPHYDSWRKGIAHTVDISDVRPRGIDNAGGRRKNNDKRLIPRPQSRDNERRGALLFTQKSLHHIESDNSKPGGMKRGVLRRQESAEPPDLSESLHRSDAGQWLSPEGTDVGSSHSGHKSKVPRLIRSQTVDATKTYNV